MARVRRDKSGFVQDSGFVQKVNVCEWSTNNFTAHSDYDLKSVVFFHVKWPKSADKRQYQDRFNKTRIKHFHELGVNVCVPELLKEVHALVGCFAHGIDLMLKGQPVISYCPQIFILLDRLSLVTDGQGTVAGRVFLISMVISLVFEILMVRKDDLHHWMKSSTTWRIFYFYFWILEQWRHLLWSDESCFSIW